MASAEQTLCCLFSLAHIQSATGGFSDEHVIGKGGFGKVYKALIDGGSATVAIKRLASNSNQGETEFATEMETLTKVRHRNLVSLIGYCREEGEKILVYEYMANGTLADHLESLSLSWNQRLQICIGAGRGLDYLHTGCSIIHRDVKSTNILLAENFRAKVSDFGLAKHLGEDELPLSYVSASVKVLLEALSGRSALDKRMADEDNLCMSMWAQEKIRNGKAEQIVARGLRGEISDNCLKTFVRVATRCLHYEPKKRITMTQAVAQLELALEQQVRRGTASNRLQFWPFGSRAIASGKNAEHTVDEVPMVNHTVDEVPIYVPAFPLAKLEDMTHYFSPGYLIAKGSGGELIYRGVLKRGKDATIKQFYEKLGASHGPFIERVSRESRLRHENLVQLLGYCLDGHMRALVYEFARRVSLHSILHESKPTVPALSWAQRIKIAAAVARGLCYIHDNDLIHHDIRSSNVLLFDNEIVKITNPQPWIPCSCGGNNDTYVTSSHTCPTPPIHRPECTWDSQYKQGDVYGFGLVLLELLTGTELFHCTWKEKQEFVSWAKVRLFQDKVHEIVDARLKADYPLKAVEKMGSITKLCLHYDINTRPDMSTVSQALQIALQETQGYYLHKH